jgi:hypothetical protein
VTYRDFLVFYNNLWHFRKKHTFPTYKKKASSETCSIFTYSGFFGKYKKGVKIIPDLKEASSVFDNLFPA